MKRNYHYSVAGIGAEGTTFVTNGDMQCEFREVFDIAMKDTFQKLTRGRAIYGSPGVGCSGPYSIQRLVIEEWQQ